MRVDFSNNDEGSSSIKGVAFNTIIGIVLIALSFPTLFLNERNSIMRTHVLDEAQKIVVEVPVDNVNPSDKGKLAHMNGFADTSEILSDNVFGIKLKAIKLMRKVSMYQWKETAHQSEHNPTTYSYATDWYSYNINSNSFHNKEGHLNPAAMPFPSKVVNAEKVNVGAFILSSGFIDQMAVSVLDITNQKIHDPNITLPAKYQLVNNSYYHGTDINSPQVGDVKVEFSIIQPDNVSLLGEQDDLRVVPYVLNKYDNSYYINPIVKSVFTSAYREIDSILHKNPGNTAAINQIEMLDMGEHTAAQLFAKASDENSFTTWIMRFAGFIMLYQGFIGLFSVVTAVLRFVPFLRDAFEAGISLVALFLALFLSTVTIAIGWFAYRPIFAVLLVAAVGSLIWLVIYLKKKYKNQPAK